MTKTVYSTEEFIELMRAVEQAGWHIVRTTATKNGAGISVEISTEKQRNT
ncbi:galactonate dehydratase [Oceanobacillus picturae]|uniref:Galactonate dehydratase n=1 Tax=Oceanobacillus picturae TaxID=171693 RepID=A0A0U9H934_9BACI|nr:galactonate dehydratase [Oceanobacillus picturae]